jgi:hypothetical protein
MAEAVRRARVKQVPLSEVKRDLSRLLRQPKGKALSLPAADNPPACLSVLRPRKIGSTTGSKPTPDFCAGSSRRAPARERATAGRLRISSENTLSSNGLRYRVYKGPDAPCSTASVSLLRCGLGQRAGIRRYAYPILSCLPRPK